MRALSLLLVVVALPACGPSTGDSNTNWLVTCERDAECGTDALCLCGVCTRACGSDESCAELEVDARCVDPELRTCGGGVPICLPGCALGCEAPLICRDDACVPDPWRVEAPRTLRLERCFLPDGVGGCVAGNEVYQLVALGRDGSALVSEPTVTGTWSQQAGGLDMRFEREGLLPVQFDGTPTSAAGCFAGPVDDPNRAEETTWVGCLLP